MFYRSPHNYDWVEASNSASEAAGDAQYTGSLTVQSMAEDADINVLMKRFGITGQMPQSVRMPEYGDFTEVKDYFSAMQAVKKAQDQFMILPPEVRARFSNDPQRLLEFVSTPGNEAELRSLGLLNAPDRPVESGTDSSGGAA